MLDRVRRGAVLLAVGVIAVTAQSVSSGTAWADGGATPFGQCQTRHEAEVSATVLPSRIASASPTSVGPTQGIGAGISSNTSTVVSLVALQAPDAPDTIIDMGRRAFVDVPISLRPKSTGAAAVTGTSEASTSTAVAQTPLPDIGSYLTLHKETLYRQERSGFIPPSAYSAVAQVTAINVVELQICVDRNVPEKLNNGTYSGRISFDDPRINFLDVPITVRVQQYSLVLTAIFVSLLVLIGGTVFVYASGGTTVDLGVESLFTKSGLFQLWRWVQANLVPVAAGIAAGTVAFVANSWYDPTWGWNAPAQWFTLLGVTFAAYTAGLSAGSAKFQKKNAPNAGGAGQSTTTRLPQAAGHVAAAPGKQRASIAP